MLARIRLGPLENMLTGNTVQLHQHEENGALGGRAHC